MQHHAQTEGVNNVSGWVEPYSATQQNAMMSVSEKLYYLVDTDEAKIKMLLLILYNLRYLGHILRMPESRVVRRALVALAKGGSVYPKGSLFMDCQTMKFHQLVALAQRRGAWNALAKQLRWDGLPSYHWTPWVWDGTHTLYNPSYY